MDNLDAALDAIYAETDAATEVVEDAVEETATDDADVAADDVETAETETADEDEEQSESDDSAESDEVDETVGHDDALSDLLEEIPSSETIAARFPRVPQAARDEMVHLADNWRADRTLIEEIGGRETAEIFKPVADMLQKAERGAEDTRDALASLATINPNATAEMIFHGATELLFAKSDDPAMRVAAEAGNAILESRFGEGITAEVIEKLVALKNAEYIDIDGDLALLEQEGTGSKLFEKQQSKISAQEARISELENLIKNPDQIERSTDNSSATRIDAELDKRLAEGVEAFRERVRWGKDSALYQITTEALKARLKSEPEYKEALALANQSGKIGEKLPHLIDRKLYTLLNKGKAKFVEIATNVNKDLASVAKTSQNAKLQAKDAKVTPAPVKLSNEPVAAFGGVMDLDSRLAAIYSETDNKLRAAGGN